MLLNQSSLESIHRFCTANRPLLERSSSAVCICCGERFAPSEIDRWVDEMDTATNTRIGETATCPRCGHDAVLPSAAPVVLSPRLLAAVQSYWFGAERHPESE